MPKKFELPRILLSLATASLLAEITLLICAFPSQAASIAFSQIATELDNFSHKPNTTQTFTDTTTLAIALTDSLSSSIAQAQADFFVNPTLTTSEILSSATGEGNSYFSSAQSEAQIIGDFAVNAGDVFYFEFSAAINSLTLIDDLSSNESASALGELSFLLVDTFNPSLVYDSFLLSFNSNLPSSSNSLNLQSSNNFLLESHALASNSEPNKNISTALIQGSYSQQFENLTSISLIQNKTNQGIVAVPEPETFLGALFFIGLIGIKYKTKKKSICRN